MSTLRSIPPRWTRRTASSSPGGGPGGGPPGGGPGGGPPGGGPWRRTSRRGPGRRTSRRRTSRGHRGELHHALDRPRLDDDRERERDRVENDAEQQPVRREQVEAAEHDQSGTRDPLDDRKRDDHALLDAQGRTRRKVG